MGAALSIARSDRIDAADPTLGVVCSAPVDASDLKTPEATKAEVVKLRKALQLINAAKQECVVQLSPRVETIEDRAETPPAAVTNILVPFKMQAPGPRGPTPRRRREASHTPTNPQPHGVTATPP